MQVKVSSTLTLWVDLFGDLQSVRVGKVRVGGGNGQKEAVVLGDELHEHFFDLVLNVCWLVAHWHLRHPRKIHQSQVQH